MAAARTGIFCLSGYNLRAVVALCRYGQAQGVPVHVAARGPADPLLLTGHAGRVFTTRSSPALQIDELCGWVEQLRREHGHERIVLAPSTEFFNRFALVHREALARCGAVLPLVDLALYEAVSDKQAFGAMCRRHGIGVPQEQAAPPARLPFVAKPIRYAGADGRQLKPHLILQPADWQRFQAQEQAGDFYFQEYVHGQSLYLLLYLPRTGPAVRWSQENLLQQARGGSIILARRSDFHTSPEADRYVGMLRAEGFRGLVMVEVRRCPDSGRCVMIEANPRMWGPMQFVQDNGVDLFGALLHDELEEAPAPLAASPVSGEYYYWSGGLVPASQPYAFHGGYDASRLLDEHARIAACDLFLRDDTLALHRHEMSPETPPMTADPTLLALYQNASKHSHYQVLPGRVQALLPPQAITVHSRHERERLDYLAARLDVAGMAVADIGGNTGYFSFELLERGAATVDYYEGNAEHAAFVAHAARALGLDGRLRTHHGYLDFERPELPVYDLVLLLNVLHHIGDDYGDKSTRIEQVQATVRAALRAMAPHARQLVFQLGFNWRGDRHQPIFAQGSKAEVIELVRGLAHDYEVQAIGIAGRNADGRVSYRDLDDANLARDDRLGEFLNRPLFILRSRRAPAGAAA